MLPALRFMLLPALAVFLFSCNNSPSPAPAANDYFAITDSGVQTGGINVIPIETPRGKFNVWTKRIGNNPKIKVLLLTGGPGASHEYAECFESFFPKEGIEFIYYDQLGCGNSDVPKDTTVYSLARSVNELEQVRKALHLDKDNFYLWGHSWGGLLAMEYALQYQQHLKALIISNMVASAKDYNRYASEVLAKQMDPKVLDTIRQLEAKGDYNNPKYMELLMPHFYAQHVCRLQQWPEPVLRSFNKLNQQFYVRMQGPSEFGLSGELSNWERKDSLPKISVPTLAIGAKYDTMNPDEMKAISTSVQNGSYLHCPNGSHLCLYDDQQVYMKGLIRFIQAVNNGEKKVVL